MSAIAALHVSKVWKTGEGSVRAVDDVSFAFDAGTLNVLLGPSGCGKSTTLRLIAGLEAADAGRILIANRDVTRLPPAARSIAMVFQSYALFPSELSGGQQQRVALGRAIIAEAPVCLMDEPLSNLDAQLRAEMRVEIRALQRKLGITMVYVTHDQVEAMSMADRVVLMRAGRIEQDGTPVDLYEDPANTFVARFIGTPPMNLLRLASTPAGAVIAGTEGPVVLNARLAPGTLGVRPEHMALAFDAGLPASVDSVEYLGGDSLVSCRIGMQPVAVRVSGSVGLAPGDRTFVTWVPGAQHYFDSNGVRAPAEVREPSPTLFA
jgi:sn-glycerol 3-phosphate transport system ATP-binding protein